MKRRIALTAALTAVAFGTLAAFATPHVLDCPSVDGLRTYRPPEATRIFALDSSVVADLSPQRRVVVTDADIPATVRNGFVAVEDRRFWEHGGIDVRGIGRAVVHDLASLSFREGFSTITMQLTRSLFPEELPSSQKSLRRKVCEVYLAGRIERNFSKREILNLYLNQIILARGIYGVEMASQYYFGKPVREVTTAEAALLIGLNRNSGYYNPRKSPQRALSRRNTVLGVLARERVITPQEALRARQEALTLAPPPEAAGPAPYFVAEVRNELRERFGADADVSGLRVYTGLDPDLQQAARRALVAQIQSIEAGKLGPYPHKAMPADAAASPGASPYLQGAVVALDTHTGEVRALVGGRDFAESQYDRAFQARRQPGSAFKPLVYATAIQQGVLTPVSRIETGRVPGAGYTPDDEVPDSVISLSARQALAKSSNAAAVRVGGSVGPRAVIQTARALGITTPIPPYPSIFLGAADVTPIELVAAYAAFGNGGMRVTPHLIQRVEDKHGKVLWRATASQERGIDPAAAFITLSMMQDVVAHGTGYRIWRSGFHGVAAGKTGTTNDVKDVWFVGLTPGVAAGVWLGFDRPQTITAGGSGGALAAPVWGAMMGDYYGNRSTGGWEPPDEVVRVWVDTASGQLATPGCPPESIREEYFMPGTEPREYCPLHGGPGGGPVIGRVLQGLRKIF